MKHEKLIKTIHQVQGLPVKLHFDEKENFIEKATDLLLYSMEHHDFTVLDWVMQETHVTLMYQVSPIMGETLIKAAKEQKNEWLGRFLSSLNLHAHVNDVIISSTYEHLAEHFEAFCSETQSVIEDKLLAQYRKDKFLSLATNTILQKIIEQNNLKSFHHFYKKYEQFFAKQHSRIKEMNECILLNSLFYANRDIFLYVLGKIKEPFKQEQINDISLRIGMSGKKEVLDWLPEMGLSFDNVLVQEDIILSSLNMGGNSLAILPEVYARGGRFYHTDSVEDERWEHKQTLFEDFEGRTGEELQSLITLMYEYEPEHLPVLLKDIDTSPYSEGVEVAQKIILNLQLQENLSEKNTQRKHKI